MQRKPEMSRTMPRYAAMIAVLVAAGALTGCVVEPRGRAVVRDEGVVVAVQAPPPPRVEARPPPPNERVEWDPGHWNWNGREYAWMPGHYVERPRQNVRWEPGHWDQRNGGYVWVEGGWR
jgi:hypothetical protein